MQLKLNAAAYRWMGISAVVAMAVIIALGLKEKEQAANPAAEAPAQTINPDNPNSESPPLLESTKESLSIHQEIGKARYEFIYVYPTVNADGSIKSRDKVNIKIVPNANANGEFDQDAETLLLKLYARIRMKEHDGLVDHDTASIIIETIYTMDAVVKRQQEKPQMDLAPSLQHSR